MASLSGLEKLEDPTTENPNNKEHSTEHQVEDNDNSLCLPHVEVDERVNEWLSQRTSAEMAPHSEHSDDTSNLGDSNYDFIDTDEESRDGHATESVASADYCRPDDLASLADSMADTEQSEDEHEPEASRLLSGIPSFAGLDEPTDTPTIGQSAANFVETADKTVSGSIEFEEPYTVGVEEIYVKHTVTEFNKEQTANILEHMKLSTPPQRLVATIRQTMTKQSLSAREPLRILYVGSHSAQNDIIHKIASSVAASVSKNDLSGSSRSSQLYNVVPVTAFGSDNTPEIELMHSSGYQIKVEDCSKAVNIKFEDHPRKPDVIKLILDYNTSYHSVPDGQGYIIEPTWELPHIAVFYCSEADTSEMIRTRSSAMTFMTRHKIPQIVISHQPLFETSTGDWILEQHPIHMCLESRDPTKPRNTIHQRLPVDLASFLNIDARQMNRNLAYLTKLHDLLQASEPVAVKPRTTSECEKSSKASQASRIDIRSLLPYGVVLVSLLATVLVNMYGFRSVPGNLVSINGNLTSTNPHSVVSTALPVATVVMSTASLRTSTETRTSTRTITVSHATPSPLKSLSVIQDKSISYHSSSGAEPSSICSAEMINEQEILIRIPSATKLSWLAREAISVNVTRDDQTVETERVSSSNDGIILHFSRKEAYGILNVSVATTKKPKINETFQVDFGHSWFQRLSTGVQQYCMEMLPTIDLKTNTDLRNIRAVVENTRDKAEELLGQTHKQREAVNHQARVVAENVKSQVMEMSKSFSEYLAGQGEHYAHIAKENAKYRAQEFQKPVADAVLRAQIRSKIMWLNMQGKLDEAAEYERRAAIFLSATADKSKKKSNGGTRRKDERKKSRKGKIEFRLQL
jgi:hypothetical protein